jgi:hypothetical protein
LYTNSLSDVIKSIDAGRYHSTMQYMMAISMPVNKYMSYLSNNVNLAGGYPTILLLFFDRFFYQICIHLFISMLVAISIGVLYNSLIKKWFVTSILSIKITFALFSFYGMGMLGLFFNPEILIFFIFLIGCLFIDSRYIIRKNKKKYALIARNTND